MQDEVVFCKRCRLVVGAGEQAAAIAAHAGLAVDQVTTVREVECEHLVVLGIATGHRYGLRFCNATEPIPLASDGTVDTVRIARDAGRLAAVPAVVAQGCSTPETEHLAAQCLLGNRPA